MRNLATLLGEIKPADLATKRPALEKLAEESQLALTRQIAYAALLTADQAGAGTWEKAEAQPTTLADVVASIPLILDSGVRQALYPKIEPLLRRPDLPDVRRSAITSISSIPGHAAESFAALSALLRSGTEPEATVASIQLIPRKAWATNEVVSLIDFLVPYLTSIPIDKRADPEALNAFQLASDLATLLPADRSRSVTKALRDLGTATFVVRTVPEQMLYDKTLLVVEVGKPVQIILHNEDAMQHNLVVVAPGATEEIGMAAEKMPARPDAFLRVYVPDSPKVLYATKLLDPGERTKLTFSAPSEPGEYPYLCTYPGHWRRMVGTLAVVTDVDVYLAGHTNTEPKITEWKVVDFAGELGKLQAGRDYLSGRELFTKLACAQCHKLGPEGYNYGPELTEVFKKYKNDPAAVLQQILEPSSVIDPRYRNCRFNLKSDDSLTGIILKEDTESVTVQSGPSEALIQTVKKSEIRERLPQLSSPMPIGLLSALSKAQVLDLLAYLEAGGQARPHEHH